MNFKKLIALLLCFAMLLPCLFACDDKDDKDDKDGSVEDVVNDAIDAMKKTPFRMTTYKKAQAEGYMETTREEENVCYCDGNKYAYFQEGDTEPYMIYADGVIYDLTSKKKVVIDDATLAALTEAYQGDMKDFLEGTKKYANVEVTEDEDGNTVVLCTGLSEFGKTILGTALVGFEIQGIYMEFDDESVYCKAVIGQDGLPTKQSSSASAHATVAITGASAISMSYVISTEFTYEYGDAYKVTVPADAAEYEEVSSIAELY